MLQKLKLLLGINDTSQDTLLMLLIEQAIDNAKAYTHLKNISDMENIILQMAAYSYSRKGTEGLKSESYSGVSFVYTDTSDYPSEIIKVLNTFRKVRTIE